MVSIHRDSGKHSNMCHQKEKMEGGRNSIGRVKLQWEDLHGGSLISQVGSKQSVALITSASEMFRKT